MADRPRPLVFDATFDSRGDFEAIREWLLYGIYSHRNLTDEFTHELETIARIVNSSPSGFLDPFPMTVAWWLDFNDKVVVVGRRRCVSDKEVGDYVPANLNPR